MKDDTAQLTSQCLSDVRLCVTGGSGVGKSALTVRFLTRRFIGEYQEDAEYTYRGLIGFGPDTIKYDLKDTNRSPAKSFFLTWPTCIAVIYSISDIRSFVTASDFLKDIQESFNDSIQCKNNMPSLALIGNKSDLGHLRVVQEEEGQRLAHKHDATFWEASASEDYYSTFRPLTALIIKSFMNRKMGSRSLSYSGDGDKTASNLCDDDVQSLLRRYSEPTNNSSRLISPSKYQLKHHRNGNENHLSNDLNTENSSPTISGRHKLREFKSKSHENMTSILTSTSRSTTPPTQTNDIDKRNPQTDIIIEVTDTTTNIPSSDVTRNYRSQSLPKNHSSSRFVQRKGKGPSKQYLVTEKAMSNSIEKSHSFTDLKTLQYSSFDSLSSGVSSANSDLALTSGESAVDLNTLERSNSVNALLSRSQSMRYSSSKGQQNGSHLFKSLNRSSSVRYSGSVGKLDIEIQGFRSQLKSISTSSFIAIDEAKNNKHLWNRLRRDRQKLNILFPSEKNVSDTNETNINQKVDKTVDTVTYNNLRSKLMRRKISSMFRPWSMNMSTD